MKEQLISYNTAILADKCKVSVDLQPSTIWTDKGILTNLDTLSETLYFYVAPTQSLLEKWLREKHKLISRIIPVPWNQDSFKYYCEIYELYIDPITSGRKNMVIQLGYEDQMDRKYHNTYEDALESALYKMLTFIKLK